MNAHSDSKAPRVFPGILFLLAIPLLLGGLQLVLLGGSLYYLIAGFFLVSCAVRLWQQNPAAPMIYAVFMLITVLWSLPPKARPISCRDLSKNFFIKYIAT